MTNLDSTVFKITTIHRVSFHDYFPDYEKLSAFLRGMEGIVRDFEDCGQFTQTTVEMNDSQYQRFVSFAEKLKT